MGTSVTGLPAHAPSVVVYANNGMPAGMQCGPCIEVGIDLPSPAEDGLAANLPLTLQNLSSAVRKVVEMEGRLKTVGDRIAELDAQKDALLAELAQVEASLTRAHAERADLEESRNVFEEGIAFSMDALQHQVIWTALVRSIPCNQASCQDTSRSHALRRCSPPLAQHVPIPVLPTNQ